MRALAMVHGVVEMLLAPGRRRKTKSRLDERMNPEAEGHPFYFSIYSVLLEGGDRQNTLHIVGSSAV